MGIKLKFNWGTGIAIFYVTFVIAILTFVVWVSNISPDLVTENYYSDELKFQKVIESRDRANKLVGKVNINARQGEIELILPNDMNKKLVEGELYLYRESDKKRDIHFQFEGKNLTFSFISSKVIKGKWKAKLSWDSEGKDYYHETNLWVE